MGNKIYRPKERACCRQVPCEQARRWGEGCNGDGTSKSNLADEKGVLRWKRGRARRRMVQAKSLMRAREAITFLGSSRMICLPRGTTRDLFPVLETVSYTHGGFYPGLLTRSKAMLRDRLRTGLLQKTTTKVLFKWWWDLRNPPEQRAKRSVLQRYRYTVEQRPQPSDTTFCFVFF